MGIRANGNPGKWARASETRANGIWTAGGILVLFVYLTMVNYDWELGH